MSASLHKTVTFARAVDWIEEVFQASNLKDNYRSAFSLFDSVRVHKATKETTDWAVEKGQKWGLSVSTIREWLYTKQALAPDVYAEAKAGTSSIPTSTFVRVADRLSGKPELQRAVIEKAKTEDLTGAQVAAVASAVRTAPNEEAATSILRQPVSRTADDLTHSARVEQLLREPKVEPSPRQVQRELKGPALEVYLDLQQQVHNIKRLSPESIEALTVPQRAEMLDAVDELMKVLQEFRDMLGGSIEGSGRVVEGRILEGR